MLAAVLECNITSNNSSVRKQFREWEIFGFWKYFGTMTTVNEDGCSNGADTINGENIMEFLSVSILAR